MLVRARPRQRMRRGAVAVEMALILPFLMMVILGIIECGQVMTSQEIITNASREGARLASLGGSTVGTSTSTGAHEVNNRVRSYLDTGGISSSAATITVTDLDGAVSDLPQSNTGDRIQVAVSVPFNRIAWSTPWFFNGAILSNSSIMRKESP
jgi:Flp pilus assembly protein TadG